MIVPKGLCDKIERIVQKFVWGSTNGNAKVALVSWDLVCQPKSHGGLGLRHLEDHNTSFMINVGFNIVSNVNALWVLKDIINKIVGIPPLHPSLGPDKIVWGATSTGLFSLKSAYKKIRNGTLNPKKCIWEMPWRFNGPQRICFFLWLTLKRRLLKNVERTRRDSNWVSLRTNGSVSLDEGFATVGGFVCDHNDGWIMGFCRYLGNCTVVEAELWGILNGLNLILDRWFERVLIQTDIIEVVNAIQEGSSGNSNFALVRRIHLILKM
ncbi:hypothetical protein Gorai_004449, partial [Gossypium raimondii]|nr:hypothetical protein [Gossypium raimondii]